MTSYPRHPTFSGTALGGRYFVVQGLAIPAWWLYLAFEPSARGWFVPPGASAIELDAFRPPDLLVATPASLGAGAALLAGARLALPLAWFSAGSVVYAFVYCVAWSLLRDGGWLNVALMAPAALLSSVSALDASPSIVTIFRRATPGAPRRHVLMTLAQIAAFWSFFLIVVPAALVYVEHRLPWHVLRFEPPRALAALLFLGCSSLGFWSGMSMAARGKGTPLPFASPNRLVITGPYAYVRNPMVIAGLGQGLAVALCSAPGPWSRTCSSAARSGIASCVRRRNATCARRSAVTSTTTAGRCGAGGRASVRTTTSPMPGRGACDHTVPASTPA